MKKTLSISFFFLLLFFVPLRNVYAQNPGPGQSCSTCSPVCTGGKVCLTDGSGGCACLTRGAVPGPGQSCSTCSPVCSGSNVCLTDGNGGCTCSTRGSDPAPAGDNPFGTVTNPLPYGSDTPGGGLIILLTNVIRLIMIVSGIFAFIRIILAGFQFIQSAGDPKGIEAAWGSIWQSLLGIIIVISSFAIAVLIGQLLFGNPTAILSPQIYGPGTTP